MFTAEELEALVLGARWVEGRQDGALSLAARTALAKIAAASPDELKQRIDEAGLWPVDSQWRESNAPLLATVREAMRARARSIRATDRSEEHTSELQSLMRISYAVFCLKKKNKQKTKHTTCVTSDTHNIASNDKN